MALREERESNLAARQVDTGLFAVEKMCRTKSLLIQREAMSARELRSRQIMSSCLPLSAETAEATVSGNVGVEFNEKRRK